MEDESSFADDEHNSEPDDPRLRKKRKRSAFEKSHPLERSHGLHKYRSAKNKLDKMKMPSIIFFDGHYTEEPEYMYIIKLSLGKFLEIRTKYKDSSLNKIIDMSVKRCTIIEECL